MKHKLNYFIQVFKKLVFGDVCTILLLSSDFC